MSINNREAKQGLKFTTTLSETCALGDKPAIDSW